MIGGISAANMMESFQLDSESISSQIMSKLDTDSDGALLTEELNTDNFMGQLLSQMDSDADGTLSSDELQSGLEELTSSVEAFSQVFGMGNGMQAPPPPPPPESSSSSSSEETTDALGALTELFKSGNTDAETISAIMETFGSSGSSSDSDSLLSMFGSSSDDEESASII
jgi:hypothetical protein